MGHDVLVDEIREFEKQKRFLDIEIEERKIRLEQVKDNLA